MYVVYHRILNETGVSQSLQVLGNFIARAVADDCIPPKFVQRLKSLADTDLARQCVEHADALLSMKHGLVKLDTVWGVTGGMRPVKYLVRQIKLLLKELLSSGDIAEATRCLQELDVPHFHHELVYEAVVLVLEDMKESTMDLIRDFLKSLSDAVIVTVDQLKNVSHRASIILAIDSQHRSYLHSIILNDRFSGLRSSVPRNA